MAPGCGSARSIQPKKLRWPTIELLSGCGGPRPCSISRRSWLRRLSRYPGRRRRRLGVIVIMMVVTSSRMGSRN
ncbi:unnamed protein product [Linum tenue]|uniref:Uncharacterized protein n=1 Tax=Linum tenue TaxID=586396 RepID=A0AAV0MG34_9ROSI|nr:unnamed protein product [Linum tenue]